GAEYGAWHIDPARLRVGALGQDPGRYDQRGQAEGHVEQENPPPAPRPDQRPAQDRAEREREPGYRGPDTERAVAAAFISIELPDHRQRAGLPRRRPYPHDRPGRNQYPDAGSGGGQRGAGAVHTRSGQHDLLAAELIAQHPAGQHETGERQGVGPDHPLQRGASAVQVLLNAGQRDADHRVVEESQEQDRAQGREGERAAPRGGPIRRAARERIGHAASSGKRRAAWGSPWGTPGRPARRSSRWPPST